MDALGKKRRVEPGTVIALGVDGARHDDAIAVIATEVEYGYQWPILILERPEKAPEDYEHDQDAVDGAVDEAFKDYMVWRAYCDDQYIGALIDKWANKYGTRRRHLAHQPAQADRMGRQAYEEAIASGDVSHDANPVFTAHMRHARKRMLTILDDHERQMHTLSKSSIKSPAKIDAAMAAVLSWEARSDALAAGAVSSPTPRTPASQAAPDL